MQISELRHEVSKAVHAFAWDQWSQMGLLGDTLRHDRWAADPEALLLFTFEIARDEPRLLDEVLDWLLVNQRLISSQRLRNLCRDNDDNALVEAVLAWLARRGSRARSPSEFSAKLSDTEPAQPLFRGLTGSIAEPDEEFERFGFLKPATEPSGKSIVPDARVPINFAFRMRYMFGIGAKAEVVRVLLTTTAPRLSVQEIAVAAGYSKRNVQQALTSLNNAGTIEAVPIGNEQQYSAPRDRWGALLDLTSAQLPVQRHWAQLFHALARITRWLSDPNHGDLSDYMRASEARLLIDEIRNDLRFAGVSAPGENARGEEYWKCFVDIVRAALRVLD